MYKVSFEVFDLMKMEIFRVVDRERNGERGFVVSCFIRY